MDKLHALFASNWFVLILQAVFVTLITSCLFFYPKEYMQERLPLLAFFECVFVISGGALLALCFLVKKPDFSVGALILWLVVGFAVFAGLYFGLTRILSLTVNHTIAGIAGTALVLGLTVACLIVQDVFCFMRGQKFLLVLAAVACVVAYGFTGYASFGRLKKGWLFKGFSQDKVTFESASYEAFAVGAEDVQNNRTWYENNVLYAVGNGKKPVYDFALGGKKLSENMGDWTHSVAEESYAFGDGEGRDVVLKNDKEKVKVIVKTVWYEKTATFEWTLYVENVGDGNSSVLSDFYPIATTVSGGEATLYFSGGSDFLNNDFALYTRKLTGEEYVFDTTRGRTTQTYLPFFNVCDGIGGFTLGLGWTGEWKTVFSYDNGVRVCAGQKALEGYLKSGETIRSPLVSLSFYKGNPLKGFNAFRRRVLDSLPEGYGPMKTFAFAGAEGEKNMGFAGEAGTKRLVEYFESHGLIDTVDYAWYDAGWFDVEGLGQWGGTVGDWEIDPRRYPDGLKVVSDYLKKRNIGMILWYEPERIPDRSKIFQTAKDKPGWLLAPVKTSSGSYNNYLWNMGDPEANADLCERIDASIKANGVAFYRQDFNIDPGEYWEKADKELYDGRTGFCENKYVVGLYKYLDYLVEQNPGLLIDNCASGGRRLDLEMCRRSVPLWRSDYNCFDYPDLEEASQYQTYGINLWLPLTNCGDDWTAGEYDYRSCIGPIIECYPSFLTADTEGYAKYVAEYEQIKEYFLKNYYPLTPCTISDRETVAMQFGDEKEGVILVFARSATKNGEKTFVMNGLDPATAYELKTIEGEAIAKSDGSRLMSDGFTLKTEKRTAYIVVYKGEKK